MKIYQSSLFAVKIKKFHKDQKLILDKEIKNIAANPKIGEEKKGALRGIYLYKFKIRTQQYLLAYRKIDGNLELITIGSHENYYKNLKIYLSS
jgi:mRNA-degrading endonuclease RelE of RelBE toxin-antitoxin system